MLKAEKGDSVANPKSLTVTLAPAIHYRQSTTDWSPQPLQPIVWEVLLEAARRAPSSWNHQPARYVVVDHQQTKKRLMSVVHRGNAWAGKSPGWVVQFACPADDDIIDGKPYYLYDCGLAMMSLIYQAQVLGLVARQMIGWDEQGVKEVLALPKHVRVVVITALGYPPTTSFARRMTHFRRRMTQQHKRFSVEYIAAREHWGSPLCRED